MKDITNRNTTSIPDEDPQADDPMQQKHAPNDTQADTSHDKRSDTLGIIDNLDRNIGRTYGLDGKAYQIGISVKGLIHQIEFMRQVIETNDLPYQIKYDADGAASALPGKMADFMDQLPSFSRLIFDGLALSPDLALFHRVYALHRVNQYHGRLDSAVDVSTALAHNDFVMALRAEGSHIGIRQQIKNWRRNADENAKRLKVYVNALHDCFARLMVIRLDLMYRQAACQDEAQALDWHEHLQGRNEREYMALSKDESLDGYCDDLPRVDIFTVTEDWRHFKDNMRGKPSLFRHMVGYVTSIEFSSIGGHHLHVALIFDGSQVKQHEWRGDQIGQYWVEITGGRGYYHNCNRGSYKYPGTGMIDHHDAEKRRNLMRSLMYLAKKDQFVRVKASPKSKTFMTGHLPNLPSRRAGRPRTKGVDPLSSEAPESPIDLTDAVT